MVLRDSSLAICRLMSSWQKRWSLLQGTVYISERRKSSRQTGHFAKVSLSDGLVALNRLNFEETKRKSAVSGAIEIEFK